MAVDAENVSSPPAADTADAKAAPSGRLVPQTPPTRPPAPIPLVPVALLMAGGIALGRYAPAPLGLWLIGGMALLAVGAAAIRRPHLRPLAAPVLAAAVDRKSVV
jgi:hypothetical protein